MGNARDDITSAGAADQMVAALREAARPLLDAYGFLGVTLFGSYTTGSATEGSDVDLYVLVPEKTKTKRVFEFAYDLGERLGVDVDAYGSHEVPTNSRLYQQIQQNGVVL